MKKITDYKTGFLLLITINLIIITAIVIVVLQRNSVEQNLTDCQSTLSQIHITNLDLIDKNKKLETELANSKSKIQTLEENNHILSNKIIEYREFLNNVENDNKQEIINTINKWEIGQELPLPEIPSNMKLCTDYRFYNIKGTPHNRLQLSAWTDEFGCRRYNDDYIVGLGSFYSVDIGDRFEITLDTGRVFTIILGDGKADCDTDELNMFTPCFNYDGEYCANILEFIVDKDIMYDKCYQYGSLDYHDEFKGDIVKMVYLGRDNGGDWTTYE